ncbi:MAG: cytidine deaminase [Bacteroidota bacterium]|nr:cytidine deaminase [Bacteroidota bacterium]MDP4211516.1 cytidine deaminase [Bacteroidota bacterium]MDP4249731.1 cytidine deaminase [Bacteroidota bacterium]
MKKRELTISVDVYADCHELETADAQLLDLARKATVDAYAPYSRFRVGAAVRLANGKMLTGTNQENASFPAGICAERVALSAASALYPGIGVTDLAVSFFHEEGKNDRPISPCGICRQTLTEYEIRAGQPIRLILGGSAGEIFVLTSAADLLPFAFTSSEIK